MRYTANEQKIFDKCDEIVAIAEEKFNVDLSDVKITLDVRGRNAGIAQWRRTFGETSYKVRFNNAMINGDAFDDMINDTVPHELAHIVCYMRPELGKNHDAGWKRVCIALGGSGERCHSNKTVHARGRTYEYITSTKKIVRLGDKYHARVQNGETLYYRSDWGSIPGFSPCLIIGERGVAYDKPVQFDPKRSPVADPTPPEVRQWRQIHDKVARKGTKKALNIAIITKGKENGDTYTTIINAMMVVNGYDRARAERVYRDIIRETRI